jgi:small subunit ribosomal protein S6
MERLIQKEVLMNLYEKIIILDANLEDTAADETVGKIRDIIINQGGEILKTEKLGRRKLAYELNKHQKGNYILLLFKSPPPTIAELEKQCKIMDPVIKFMVVKLTKKKQIEAVMASLAASKSKEQPEKAPPAKVEVKAEVKPEGEAPETPEEKESV